MKIDITKDFRLALLDQVLYISKEKPIAARKFKTELIKNIRKDLKQPFRFKKSIYFNDENIRDYVFKGYTISYQIIENDKIIRVIGIIKNKYSY